MLNARDMSNILIILLILSYLATTELIMLMIMIGVKYYLRFIEYVNLVGTFLFNPQYFLWQKYYKIKMSFHPLRLLKNIRYYFKFIKMNQG